MARRDSTRLLLLWFLLLGVPLFALGLYLRVDEVAVADPSAALLTNDSPNSHDNDGTLSGAEAPSPSTPPMESPVGKPTEVAAAPVNAAVVLDLETARAAVQQVENTVYERATVMFEQEPIDVDWAGIYEQSLREMFAQHTGLQRVSVNSISCHTSMCRIEVFTPRDNDADFFTAMFYDGLANFRAGELKSEAVITRRMEQGMTSVYVARKGHTPGFY